MPVQVNTPTYEARESPIEQVNDKKHQFVYWTVIYEPHSRIILVVYYSFLDSNEEMNVKEFFDQFQCNNIVLMTGIKLLNLLKTKIL